MNDGFIDNLNRTKPLAIIAECKKASPSAGILSRNYNPSSIAKKYEQGGAAAISVLTEQTRFQGDMTHLVQVKQTTMLPVLQKDFIIYDNQIYTSSVMGADAVLLIARIIRDKKQLKELNDLAHKLDMDVVLEVHTREELERVKDLISERTILGFNTRDIGTYQHNSSTVMEIITLPDQIKENLIVASYITHREQIDTYMEHGINKFLIGTALMLAYDPVKKLKEFNK